MCENAKSRTFLGKNPLGVPVQVELYRYRYAEGNLYRYRSRVYRYRYAAGNPYRTGQRCTDTGCSSSPVLTCFHIVKSRIRIPMSRDPKK